MSLVTGTETTKPATGSDEWQIKADKVLITIIANCEEEAQTLIEVCETPAEAWNVLKYHYEARTRTHMSALLLAIVKLKFDDRKTIMTDHIAVFENKWNVLRLTAESATMGTDSMAAGIKSFTLSEGCKATMLLATLPQIQTYQNIIDEITSSNDAPIYANVVLRLTELSDKTHQYTHLTATAPPVDPPTDEWSALTTTDISSGVDHRSWWLDSCSSVHITHDLNDLVDPQPHIQAVRMGDGATYSSHKGSAIINHIILTGVLCVPLFPRKLLSLAILEEQGWDIKGLRKFMKADVECEIWRAYNRTMW